jgi:hypothetical protein
MNGCSRAWLISAGLIVCLFGGCRALSSRPNQEIVDDFALVDAIEVSDGTSVVRIDDPKSIARLRAIYSEAKWKTYIATLPSKMSHMRCLQGDNELFHLDYAGVLMEIAAYDDVRYAELDDDARNWIDELFPKAGGPEPHE